MYLDGGCNPHRKQIPYPQAKDMANSLRLIQKDQEIESLKIQNLLLTDDLECAIDGLIGIREQLDLLFCDLGVNG